MPNKKSSGAKKAASASPKSHKNAKVMRHLHISGLLMMICSVFMVAMPSLYSGVYYHLTHNTTLPQVDTMMNTCVVAGEIIALLYCLIGLFVFRAGEQGTYLAKGMSVFNTIMAGLALAATILIFLPVPDETFSYAMQYYNSGAAVDSGFIPMAIVTLVDMAFIVGITLSVTVLDDICILESKKK